MQQRQSEMIVYKKLLQAESIQRAGRMAHPPIARSGSPLDIYRKVLRVVILLVGDNLYKNMEKLDYSDINKFLASLGVVIIGVGIILPYFYLKEDF